MPGCDRRNSGVFVGKLGAVTVGAEIVDFGMVVSLGKGPFFEAVPAQPLSSTKTTKKYKSDGVCLSS